MPELEYTAVASGNLNNSAFQVAGQNDYKQAKAQLSGLYHLSENYNVQIGIAAPFYTRATGAGYTGKVALWHRF
jgi:hypothetical protein